METNKDSSVKMANFGDICLVTASLWLFHTIQRSLRLCDFVSTLFFQIGLITNSVKKLANHKMLTYMCLCDSVGFKHDIVH